MRRNALLLVPALLAIGGVRLLAAPGDDMVFKSDDPKQQIARVREFVKVRYGLDPDGIENRHLAASLADKTAMESLYKPRTGSIKGKKLVECFSAERMERDYAFYRPIKKVIDASSMSDDAKELVRLKYSRTILWPQRQGAARIGVEKECAGIRALPADTKVVQLSGKRPLWTAVTKAYPAFAKLTSVQQHLVLRYLDEVNHNIRVDFSVRCKPDEVQLQIPEHLGRDLADVALDQRLFALDPTLKPEGYDKAQDPVDRHALALGDGTVRLWCYRIRPDGKVLMPPAAHLAAIAAPDRLDLRNLWLTDAAEIAALRPKELVLDGNDIGDLKPLAAMKMLEHLSLAAAPVVDLSPLKGLKLKYLDLRDTKVSDLSPLKGMQLEKLNLNRCPVKDLSPLAGMPLKHLRLWDTQVTDLTPLAGIAFEDYLLLKIGVEYDPAGLEALRNTKGLKKISDHPKEDWLAWHKIRMSKDWFPAWRGHVRRDGPVNRLLYGEKDDGKASVSTGGEETKPDTVCK